MKVITQPLWRSKGVWIGVLSQVLLIVGLVNPAIADWIKIIGGSILEIATLFGILNNSTNPDGFSANKAVKK
jgi:hypothetical protein